jgi:hypothetical protein
MYSHLREMMASLDAQRVKAHGWNEQAWPDGMEEES